MGEELFGAVESNPFAESEVVDTHASFELPGADSRERDSVPVRWVHVGLHLEDERAEAVVAGADGDVTRCFTIPGRGAQALERTEERLDAEIRERAAEEDGCDLAREEPLFVPFLPRAVEELDLVAKRLSRLFAEERVELRVVEAGDLHRRSLGLAFGRALKPKDELVDAVVDPLEQIAASDWPGEGHCAHAEHLLHFAHQGEGVAGGTIHLVDERHDRGVAHAAHVKELAGLLLDASCGIQNHDPAVGRHEGSVCVFAEIVVAGRVEQVPANVVVLELQDRSRDRDATLLFEGHPIADRGPLRLARFDRAGRMNGASVKQELLGQRRLSGVWMRDDRKRAPPLVLILAHARAAR